jgi:hypothetical protein
MRPPGTEPRTQLPLTHTFHAVAFVQNLHLKELADAIPGS